MYHQEEELRQSGEAKYNHLNEDLHVLIEVFAPPAEAYARMGHALEEIKKFLIPDYNDEIRQAQLQELTYLNGGSEDAKVPSVRGKSTTRGRGTPVPGPPRCSPSPSGMLGLTVPISCLRSPTSQPQPIGFPRHPLLPVSTTGFGDCRCDRHHRPYGHSYSGSNSPPGGDQWTVQPLSSPECPKQEGWVLRTTARPVGRNDSQTTVPDPKGQGCGPLIHRGKPQHETSELGGKQANPTQATSLRATPEYKRVQPLSRSLVPEPTVCVEVSQYLSTSHTSSGSFPPAR
ncbi:hypothetical protein CHARACLAT_021549 [Characodon lateralis]|uniref:Uncharacterized protein n=1 Tax=Characodon lateralis TaxID=208331 RepID=A0ABU7DB47_9TELE|nr:hypothetical protein [Characodon lateralis]